MSPNHLIRYAGLILALTLTPYGYAQLNRTFVSVKGADTGSCVPSAPCRTFAYAISQTNAGGEIVAIDSGGYGPFTIDKAVTVQASPGVYAGITATSGNAIQISAGASDKVTIRGLTLSGVGSGSAGIAFSGGGAEAYVENCLIDGFVNYGIFSFFPIRIENTTIRNCGSGIWIDNAGAAVKATIERVEIKDMSGGDANAPGTGILAWRNSTVVVRNCLIAFADRAFFARDGGKLNIENSLAANNSTGVRADATGTIVRISNTVVTSNTTGVSVDSPSATMETWGNNKIRGNGTNIAGTLTPVSQS